MSESVLSYDSEDLAHAFVALNEFVSAGGQREAMLQRLVSLAADVVPGCDWAALTAWPVGHQPRSLASSNAVACRGDELQYAVGEGPCLTAAADAETAVVDDLETDERWPAFARAALERTPVRSMASFHLQDEPERTALNLYGAEVAAFDGAAISVAAMFASSARILLMHAHATERAASLETALSTSRQIGVAVGIVMNAHRVTAERAFELLRESSQHLNRKLRDIAEEVGYTGRLPQRFTSEVEGPREDRRPKG